MSLESAAHDLLEACKEFVRKCECGQAQSHKSYLQMKAAIAKAEHEPLCSPDNPPFDTLEPTPAWPAELYNIGQYIRKRHPAHCRCSSKVVTAKLTTIMRDTAEAGRMATLRYIDSQHAKWCASEAWTKEGGKYAKSLEAWLSPAKRLWENEPLAAATKPEYVDRYVISE